MFEFLKKLLSSDLNELYRKGEFCILRGDYGKALEYYEEFLKIEPVNIPVIKKKIFALFSLEMYEEVIESIDKLLAILPEDIEALNGKGLTLFRQEKYDCKYSFII